MKYFFGFLASLGLIVLVFLLVMRGFGGGEAPQKKDPLSNLANTDTMVRMTVDGPIVSDAEHQAYRVTVGQSEVRIETLKGYEYDSVETLTYQNNSQAYNNFLRALDIAGFDKGAEKVDSQNEDERGVCSTGSRYIMETIDGTSQVQRYWSTSCGGQGTFKGNTQQVKQLFNNQIPKKDFTKLTRGLRLQ